MEIRPHTFEMKNVKISLEESGLSGL
jgi:hypothetical protein